MEALNRLKQAKSDLDSAAAQLSAYETDIWTLFSALDYMTSALGAVIDHLEERDDEAGPAT